MCVPRLKRYNNLKKKKSFSHFNIVIILHIRTGLLNVYIHIVLIRTFSSKTWPQWYCVMRASTVNKLPATALKSYYILTFIYTV